MPDGDASAPSGGDVPYVQPTTFPPLLEVHGGRHGNIYQWLADRADYNSSHGANGLWRVHDGLYDLNEFVDKHPGGKEWLELTRGHDITELFESHHPDIEPVRKILEKYRRGTATWPRESPLTFKPDGFYSVLRERVVKTIKEKGTAPKLWSKLFVDALVISYLACVIRSARRGSPAFAALAGLLGGFIGFAGHNYLHQKNNFRMWYEELTGGSHETWRIHHAIAHHPYPNCSLDVEYTMFEPELLFFPTLARRSPDTPVLNFLRVQKFYLGLGAKSAVLTLLGMLMGKVKPRSWQSLLTYATWAAMIAIRMRSPGANGWKGALQATGLYLLMRTVASYYGISMGLYAGHHSDFIYRQDDAYAPPLDFGLYQLEATADRVEVYSSTSVLSLPGVLVTLGDHTMHHLFPTIDHAYHRFLYADLARTCKEFGVRFEFTTLWDMIKGFYTSQSRTELNSEPRRVGRRGEGKAYKGWVDPKMGGVEGWADGLPE
ncbi:hypothetical protein DFJ74DRAFT_773841 [Hyaloraphidium curvatum]|nr:hypothetical protein DFJ74DRAFT_773841 [Hyaloraphidium curvatum]